MAELLPRLPRVEALIGCRLGDIDAAVVSRMVAMRMPEDADLEFKREFYAQTEKGHRDAASDVAAMANGQGGAVFLGIRDEDGVAAEVTPVEFSQTAELRISQAIISQTAPKPDFKIRRIPSATDPEHGVYLIAVQPSLYAPHAVRLNDRLGYPKRAGAHIRWLAESEVADAYRARFITAGQRVERVNVVRNAGMTMVGDGAWLTLALVPAVPGNFAVSYRSMQQLTHGCQLGYQQGYAKRVFTSSPQGEAAPGRVVIYTGRDNGYRRSTSGHAEMHSDGSAFVAAVVGGILRSATALGQAPTTWSVDDEGLVDAAVAEAGLALEFATERAGATGDAYLSTSLVVLGEPQAVELIHTRRGYAALFVGTHRVSRVEHSTVLISLDDAATAPGRLIITRMALNGIFQGFGYPEVPQITEEGQLRRSYMVESRQRAERWAAANGVETVDTPLEVEP